MTALRRSQGLIWFWRIHRWLMRRTNGRVGSRLMGHTVLLLTTTGRKSGQPRETALYTFPHQDSHAVIASNVGDPNHPGWYLNLLENPAAEVLIDGRWQNVKAREAEGAEREQIWALVAAKDPSYADYQARTARRFPVIVLEPQGGRADGR